ncbi:MAG: hypothetical protein EP330_24500 [Deltaproteobacteria bacterium]|nr:MAG: hypothetical protein EP330_24500 [Deltaproteobacteria bacterium]
MARIAVHGADLKDGKIASLRVRMHNLPPRTIDRDTAVAWMKDGHTLIPVKGGSEAPSLLLLEVGEELVIRDDSDKQSEDKLDGLPAVENAGI